jgi:hypothetical protein
MLTTLMDTESAAKSSQEKNTYGTVLVVDVSYAAPQAHGIVNVTLHRE